MSKVETPKAAPAAATEKATSGTSTIDFDKAEIEEKVKTRKGFGGAEKEYLEVSMDKHFFKENFPKYKELKELAKELKEWNEEAVKYGREIIGKKLKEGKHDLVEVRMPNGASLYDRITVRGRKKDDGEVRLSYVNKSTSTLPGKSFMQDEKEKLMEALKK